MHFGCLFFELTAFMQSCHFIVFYYMQFVSLPIEPASIFYPALRVTGGAVTPLPIEPHRGIHSLYFAIFSNEGNWVDDKMPGSRTKS